jgi:hypothetical protein
MATIATSITSNTCPPNAAVRIVLHRVDEVPPFMDTRGLYKQNYEAQMNGRSPDVAEQRAPEPTAEVDVDTASADPPDAGPDEITTIAAP